MVAGGHSARAIDADNLLVKLANFDHYACLVPFSGVWASLILDGHMVANYQGWESLGVLGPSLGSFHVAVSQGILSRGQGVTPSRVWLIAAG